MGAGIMTAIYVLKKGAKASRKGRRVIVEHNNAEIQSVPINYVHSIVLGEGTHISTPLMELMLEEDIPIYFIDFFGKVKGQVYNDNTSWFRSKCQMERFMEHDSQIGLIQWVLGEKLNNQYNLLKYYARYKQDLEIGQYASDIRRIRKELNEIDDVEIFRGMEGMASKKYFGAFELILDTEVWGWKGRSRRPALDPANALLNYAYAFLEREVRTAIVGAGLDPRFGFFHSNNGRKDSLVFDLMELFRQNVIDRLVLSTINHNRINPNEFENDENMGWRVGADLKRTWINIYEDYMNRQYQEYEGGNPREWIRKKIMEFAKIIFKGAVDVA